MKIFKSRLFAAFLVVLLTVGYVFAADEVLKRDENRTTVQGVVTNDAALDITMMRVDSATKALLVTSSTTAPSAVVYTDARKVVTSAGTAVAISATTSTFIDCDFQAEENNTGDIVIGGSTVVATILTRQGVLLTAGSSWRAGIPGDLDAIFIDSEVSGDGVTYLCQS